MPSEVAQTDASDVVRLAQLVWRMFKLRAFLALVVLGAILVTWSTVESGFAKARRLDVTFVEHQIDLLKGLGLKGEDLTKLSDHTEVGAKVLIGVERRLLPLLASSSASAKAEQQSALYQSAVAELEAYDAKRREAFLVEMSLPYMKGPVAIDALWVADVWPFCALAVLLVLVTLGCQQRCYEVILTSFVERRCTPGDRAKILALSQFFAGKLSECSVNGASAWLYRKPWVILPLSLILNSLAVAIVFLSLVMLLASDLTARHSTDSMLFSYYSLLWCAGVCAFGAAYLARRYYMGQLREALGARVISVRMFWLDAWARKMAIRVLNLTKGVERAVRIVVIVAIGAVAMPWVGSTSIRGYTFLWHQTPLKVTSVSGTDIVLFPIAPAIFGEMQFQVVVACVFLFMCFGGSLRILQSGGVSRILKVVREGMAYIVLFLAGNVGVHLLATLYQGSSSDLVDPLLDMLAPAAGLTAPRGFPLVFYAPTAAFGVFAGCTVSLAAANVLKSRSRVLGRSVATRK